MLTRHLKIGPIYKEPPGQRHQSLRHSETKRTIKIDMNATRKLVCYVCGENGHYAHQCSAQYPSNGGNGTKTPPRCFILLGRSIYLTATDFKGEIYVHVRRYIDMGGKLFPTKDGIALTLRRWKELKDVIPQIEERVRAYDDE
jgi:hypothetical protein